MSDLPSSIIGSKRKAGNDIESPPAQRPHPSQSESLTMYPPTTVRGLPQPDSIQAILRDNCGTRLYVRPIAWTSNQLRLLTCQFRPQKERRPQNPQTQPASQDPGFHGDRAADDAVQIKPVKGRSRRAMISANHLAGRFALDVKKAAVKTILGTYDIEYSDSDNLQFYFNRRAVARIRTEGVFTNNSVAPNLAYITFGKIQLLREKHVSYTPPRKRNRSNEPGFRVWEKKLKLLEPQNPVEDPYIVAILIALAQGQRRAQQQESQGADSEIKPENQTSHVDADITSSANSRTADSCSLSTEQMARNTANSFKVQVLAHSGIVADTLYVYTANIDSEFLDKFDEPSHYSPSCPVTIKHSRVPLTSPFVLRRIHRWLCPVSCSACSRGKAQDPTAVTAAATVETKQEDSPSLVTRVVQY
ncbi:hypothetical protein CBS147309_7597 [Penicillium roqueforti]|nr:hypothetical protein CBS147309_7597 [Penicillium roqueforti]